MNVQHQTWLTGNNGDTSRTWLPDIVDRIGSCLPDNEVACTLRLVQRATAQQFAEHTVVDPSQPVPRWCFAAECLRVCRCLTLKKRSELLCLTAASGDVANLEVALAEAGLPLTLDVWVSEEANYVPLGPVLLEAAAGAGRLATCQWLVGLGGTDWDAETVTWAGKAAAAGGHEEVVDWCLEAGACAQEVACAALRKGHEELAWRLMEAHGPDISRWMVSKLIGAAAEGCSLVGLQRAWERLHPSGTGDSELDTWIGTDCLQGAVRSLTPDWEDKCAFLLARGCRVEVDYWLLNMCAESLSGSAAVERIKWLRARGSTLRSDVLGIAAKRGDFVLVSYLLRQGLGPTPWVMGAAARAGDRAVVALQLLAVADGEPPLRRVTLAHDVAESGSVAGLSWLAEAYRVEAIGGFTSELFHQACRSGNVELMAWLLARGCEADGGAWEATAQSGCEAALEWLAQRDCPKPADDGPYLHAAQHGDLRTMAVLRRLGVSFGPDGGQALFTSLASGRRQVEDQEDMVLTDDPVRVLAWLLASGCSVDWDEAVRAAEQSMHSASDAESKGPAEVLEWLAGQR